MAKAKRETRYYCDPYSEADPFEDEGVQEAMDAAERVFVNYEASGCTTEVQWGKTGEGAKRLVHTDLLGVDALDAVIRRCHHEKQLAERRVADAARVLAEAQALRAKNPAPAGALRC